MELEAGPSQLSLEESENSGDKDQILIATSGSLSLEAAPATTPVGRKPGGKKRKSVTPTQCAKPTSVAKMSTGGRRGKEIKRRKAEGSGGGLSRGPQSAEPVIERESERRRPREAGLVLTKGARKEISGSQTPLEVSKSAEKYDSESNDIDSDAMVVDSAAEENIPEWEAQTPELGNQKVVFRKKKEEDNSQSLASEKQIDYEGLVSESGLSGYVSVVLERDPALDEQALALNKKTAGWAVEKVQEKEWLPDRVVSILTESRQTRQAARSVPRLSTAGNSGSESKQEGGAAFVSNADDDTLEGMNQSISRGS